MNKMALIVRGLTTSFLFLSGMVPQSILVLSSRNTGGQIGTCAMWMHTRSRSEVDVRMVGLLIIIQPSVVLFVLESGTRFHHELAVILRVWY